MFKWAILLHDMINLLYYKKCRKVRDHCCYREYRGAAYSISNSKYSVPKKIPIVFHNESSYGYYFIIKMLAEEFKKQFTCLGQNTQKYITFTVPIEKKLLKLIKMEKKLQNIYLRFYSFFIVQDL